MENYEQFWNNELPQPNCQIVVDWDTFISSFSNQIKKYGKYELNSIQRSYIKSKIDPQGRNEVYKSGFLLFIRDYWDIPSNRTNLFKMKMNLTKVLPRLNLMTSLQQEKLLIQIQYQSEIGYKQIKYELMDDRLYSLDAKSTDVLDDLACKEDGFISVGSDPDNDIAISDCHFIGKHQLKLICFKQNIQIKKAFYSESNEDQHKRSSSWFIRDVAKSNRLAYGLDNENKLIVAKAGMVFNIGMTGEHQLHINWIGKPHLPSNPLSSAEYRQLSDLFNSDRLNYMGEVDEKVPLKTILDLNFNELTLKDVELMYEAQLFYPVKQGQAVTNASSKTENDKEIPYLQFTIANKSTQKSNVFLAKNVTNFSFGRSKSNEFWVDQVPLRIKQCTFQCINNVWLVRNVKENCQKADFPLQKNILAVHLASKKNMNELKHSEKIKLCIGYPYQLVCKHFQIKIEFQST